MAAPGEPPPGSPPRCVGVIGARDCPPSIAAAAFEVGRRIAEAGWVLVCGGMGGVMEQACRGARAAGGLTLGILPGQCREEGNPYLSLAVVTGMGEARNVLVVRSSEVLVAVSGGYGTLSEIALAGVAGIPVVGLGSWVVEAEKNHGRGLFAHEARDPGEAIAAVHEILRRSAHGSRGDGKR